MRTALSTILTMSMLSGAAYAQSSDPAEMAGALFDRIDENGNGQIRLDELAAFDEGAFATMDENGDDGVSLDEFTGWGFGFDDLAQSGGSDVAYQTAARLVFDLIDYDDDGTATQSEMRRFRIAAMSYADHDGDSILNVGEFTDHHVYSIVARTVSASR